MMFSRVENPDTWDTEPPEVAPFAFASHEDAVRAAAMFNLILSQRDDLIEALEKQAKLTAYYNGWGASNAAEHMRRTGKPIWREYLCTEARAALAKHEQKPA